MPHDIRILDLFCCQGGAGMGYYQGFKDAGLNPIITGIDINPQPRYPFHFIQADALEFFDKHAGEFDFFHASPPCQAFTSLNFIHRREHPDLIEPVRSRFIKAGKPWVIENVPGAPMPASIMLCGLMFGVDMPRHRHFESNPLILQPPHPRHKKKAPKAGRPWPGEGWYIPSPTGHCSNVDLIRRCMGAEWMSGAGLSQAIPPVFTRYLAQQIAQMCFEGVQDAA
jgi:DNA (cytosine-5)-methyltransferase 1